jgi:vancomycin resistance protein YoaR
VAAIRAPDRTAQVRASRAPASFTNADARALGIRRQISSATVQLPPGARVDGLVTAAARLDGTVLEPDDGLSLRDRLGADVPGNAASDRLATATFDAAWLAGLEIGSHATLPTYTGAYPLGRDATLRSGQDVAFVDDTSYGVLVSARLLRPTAARSGSLTVSLWSTPSWSVTSGHTAPTNVVPGGRVVHRGSGCHERPARDGFDVTVTRTFEPLGQSHADHTTSYDVHYAPVAAVVCRPRGR